MIKFIAGKNPHDFTDRTIYKLCDFLYSEDRPNKN